MLFAKLSYELARRNNSFNKLFLTWSQTPESEAPHELRTTILDLVIATAFPLLFLSS